MLLNTREEVNKHRRYVKPVFEDAHKCRIWIVVGYSGETIWFLIFWPTSGRSRVWALLGRLWKDAAGHVSKRLPPPDVARTSWVIGMR